MSIVLSKNPVPNSPIAATETELTTRNALRGVMERFASQLDVLDFESDAPMFATVCRAIMGVFRDLESRKNIDHQRNMGFIVSGNYFPVRISAEPIADADGAEAWAITDPVAGEIVIWEKCPRSEWLHTLMHEFHRVWCIYNYEPDNQTAGAMNFANQCGEFNRQFAEQGGLLTLLALTPQLKRRRPDQKQSRARRSAKGRR
jgi:hypothetical protein